MGIESWSTSAGSNNQAPPNGWPGGMLPSQVEPTARQMMASLAAWYQAAEWINYNFTPTYISATQFSLPGNVTVTYQVGRRVQATDGATSVYGTITASAFTSVTTITVVWDTGVLQTGVTIVYVGITSAVSTSAPTPNPVAPTMTGNWTFSPFAGIGITINGVANAFAASFIGSASVGQSRGMRILAGTNASDFAFQVNNQANTVTYLQVGGSGVILGNDGTNPFELGYKDIPQNLQSANYAAALSDRGKGIDFNGTSLTCTIPANASVAFPIGTTILITNLNATSLSIAITTDTLTLAGTTTTGTRTLGQNGEATIRKVTSTSWLISGSGLS